MSTELRLSVTVPTHTGDPAEPAQRLIEAAGARQGITLTTADGYVVSLDLYKVEVGGG